MAQSCFYCGERVDPDERYVLMLGRVARPHCSEGCLERSVRNERRARAARRRRWSLVGVGAAALALGAGAAWRRFRAPPPEWISTAAPEPLPEEAPPDPSPARYGPAWPPTDEDWTFAFARGSWVYPLPGPLRRPLTTEDHIPHTEPPRPPRSGKGGADGGPPRCRVEGACGVNVGGELWGEHVYAARDGVIERVQSHGDEDGGGQFVRIAHYGGMAFTQYFHLAGTPRHIVRGARVRAGDVIGLLGDTGLDDGARHLTFTLSTRPSNAFPEVYWDPSALMATWSLRTPPHGTVAGFAPPRAARADFPPRRRAR